jgi:type II secretory pathway pseudopilin PulG
MRMRRGITLIELLVATVMSAIIAVALANSFMYVIRYEQNAPKTRQAYQAKVAFEDKIRSILEQAYISATATDQNTYFIGTVGGQNPNGSPTVGNGLASAASTTSSAASGANGGSTDGIVLTVAGNRVPNALVESQETDTETLNQTYGANGGLSEVSISMVSVGTSPTGQTGLFLRQQTPADSDYTQGGNESLITSDIKSLLFEFFDGTEWLPSWDTTQPNYHRLPAAVRVTYTLNSEPDQNHIFVIRIPLSDVTPQNPVTNGGTTTATGVVGGAGGGARATPSAPQALLPSMPFAPMDGQLPIFSNMQIVPEGSTDANAPGGAPMQPEAVASNGDTSSLPTLSLGSPLLGGVSLDGQLSQTAPVYGPTKSVSTGSVLDATQLRLTPGNDRMISDGAANLLPTPTIVPTPAPNIAKTPVPKAAVVVPARVATAKAPVAKAAPVAKPHSRVKKLLKDEDDWRGNLTSELTHKEMLGLYKSSADKNHKPAPTKIRTTSAQRPAVKPQATAAKGGKNGK